MTSVERVKSICKSRRIPISRLESDLGFGNGYIGQLKKGTFPDDRLLRISEYLGVPFSELVGAEKTDAAEATSEIGMDSFTYALQNEAKGLTDADKELLLSMARQLKEAREKADGQTG